MCYSSLLYIVVIKELFSIVVNSICFILLFILLIEMEKVLSD